MAITPKLGGVIAFFPKKKKKKIKHSNFRIPRISQFPYIQYPDK